MTPNGEGIVLFKVDTLIGTDRGTFNAQVISPALDVAAITASVESLEAWLDEPDEVSIQRIVGESRPCQCPCGKKGNCHRLVHVDVVAEVDVRVFPHTAITGECRCVMKDCTCAH